MNQLYIIFYISSIAITIILTSLFINRKAIMAKMVAYKNKRRLYREKRLETMVRRIVFEYLEELRDE